MEKFDNYEITLTNHGRFYAIAYHHHELIKQLILQRNSKKVINNRGIDFNCEKNAKVQRHAIVTVIFCALTLEAFINYYCIEHFSKNYFNNYLDGLNPVSKWLIIPKIITGNNFNLDEQAFEKLKILFKLRNKLVHYKSCKKRILQLSEKENWITAENSQESLETVKLALAELSKIDNKINLTWLESSIHNPYV